MQTNAMNTRLDSRCDDARSRAEHAPAAKVSAVRLLGSGVKQFAMAPFRVHHYRDVSSRMLREALCRTDCLSKSGD